MAIRFNSAISFSVPMHVITSGWEQESLFAMWKYVNGLDIYSSPYEIPYSIAFFNWLFYETYGQFISIIHNIFDLSGDWIPTTGRLFSIVGLLFGTIISYSALLSVTNTKNAFLKAVFFLTAIYLMFGPLIGFWGFTIRSDIWGMVLDILAVYLFWRFYGTRPYTAVVLAAIALFCAWSFKHINVYSAVAIGLYLLFSLRIKLLMTLTFVYFLFVSAALYIGSFEYLETLFFRPAIYGFDLEHLWMNLKNFVVKSAPTLIPLLVMVFVFLFSKNMRREILSREPGKYIVISILPIFAFTVFIASKNGAAENYYFVFSFYVALAAAIFMQVIFESKEDSPVENSGPTRTALVVAMITGWNTASLAVLSVLLGVTGVLSVGGTHERLSQIKSCLSEMPTPVFVPDMYASLPWMNPSDEPIILSWNYRLERSLGVPFQHGGVGGLIDSGYFASLLVPETAEELDGSRMEKYRETGKKCIEFNALVRIDGGGEAP
ncbi:exported protein of unknown function [Magnetospira sp. QH-2]|nr:exported protein of unknown function [Magnetospira sp. QH-2]